MIFRHYNTVKRAALETFSSYFDIINYIRIIMKKERIRLVFFLTLLFLILNGVVYAITESQKNEKISAEFHEKLKNLETHYRILLHNQSILADAAYTSTVMKEEFIAIMREAQNATKAKTNILRDKLYNLLKSKYENLAMQGVLQYQIAFADNVSFIRMHKPTKYGDDISAVREDFVYTNKYKLPVRAFTQGRVSHGFRNTYPIFAPDSAYLGAIEVSFSSDEIQNNLTNISQIYTHFLVKQTIFESKKWSLDDLIVNYAQSAEHKDYMLSVNKNNKQKEFFFGMSRELEDIQSEIDRGVKSQKSFSLYTPTDENDIIVASFLPIYNLANSEVYAWLVSYEKSPFIYKAIEVSNYARIVFFILILILVYLLYRLMMEKYATLREHKLVNDILNSTDNIMFITDFKTVTFSNRRFKNFFAISSQEEFKTIYGDASNMFLVHEGYLHDQLRSKNESFVDLIKNAQEEDRVVLIRDKAFNNKSFNIAISKLASSSKEDYLVTLTDITKMKEKESAIEKKIYIDGLTEIYNRTKFDEVIQHEFSRAKRYSTQLSLSIIDIDDFKQFNDDYGHLIGDEVLIMLAKNISPLLRLTDTFARWGGEEFVILFPETSQIEALHICEKLRESIAASPHPTAGNITASFGVAEFQKDDTIESIFKRCDEALYLAKKQGKNRVCAK